MAPEIWGIGRMRITWALVFAVIFPWAADAWSETKTVFDNKLAQDLAAAVTSHGLWLPVEKAVMKAYADLRKEGLSHQDAITELQLVPSEPDGSPHLRQAGTLIKQSMAHLPAHYSQTQPISRDTAVYEVARIYAKLVLAIKRPEQPKSIHARVDREGEDSVMFKAMLTHESFEQGFTVPLSKDAQEKCQVSMYPSISTGFTFTCQLKEQAAKMRNITLYGDCIENQSATKLNMDIGMPGEKSKTMRIWCALDAPY